MAQIKKKWEKRSEDNKRRGEMCVLDTIDHLQWRENLLFEIFLNGTINHFDFYKQWLDQTKYIYISFDAFVIAVQSIICCFFFSFFGSKHSFRSHFNTFDVIWRNIQPNLFRFMVFQYADLATSFIFFFYIYINIFVELAPRTYK